MSISTADETTTRLSGRHILALDGLRGIAIICVLLFHRTNQLSAFRLGFVQYGWAGVDLFFVISGFLITGILLDSVDSARYLRNFYVRRVLRIWPLYFVLLTFVFVLLPWLEPELKGRIFAQCHPWQSYLLFVQNFFVHDFGIGPVGVTWSLAIEEQFYLLWPLIILSLPRRFLPVLLLGILLLSPVGRALAQRSGATPSMLYTHTIFRLDSICAGALLAVWIRSGQFLKVRASVTWISLLAGIAACVPTLWLFSAEPVCSNLRFSALALLSFGLVSGSLLAKPGTLIYRALTSAWLRYTGKISFGLYLLHVSVFDVLTPERLAFLGSSRTANFAIIGIDFAAVFLLASCSWRFFESPILGLKSKFEYHPGS